jgi:hypothetical protein
MFDQFLQKSGKSQFILTYYNYDDQARLLVPRAVAYSAGLLNHFFRGKLSIEPPSTGFYGILDHAKFSPGGPYYPTHELVDFAGFDKIKLKLKNVTEPILDADGTPVQQDMLDGVIVAVLKFHRNKCYDDSLRKWPMTGDEAADCRSEYEEIVVSEPAVNKDGVQIDALPHDNDQSDGVELTFNFKAGRQLPPNAWDVSLQVVFRGMLGAEEDAVVVATKDISEPMFTNIENVTDYVLLDGVFYKPEEISQSMFARIAPGCRGGVAPSYYLRPECHDVNAFFTFNAGDSDVTLRVDVLDPRRTARLVLLADPQQPPQFSFDIGAVACSVGLNNPWTARAYIAQQDYNGNLYYDMPANLRGVRGWDPQICYADIGANLTPLDSVDWTQMADVSEEELWPVPITISGW